MGQVTEEYMKMFGQKSTQGPKILKHDTYGSVLFEIMTPMGRNCTSITIMTPKWIKGDTFGQLHKGMIPMGQRYKGMKPMGPRYKRVIPISMDQ